MNSSKTNHTTCFITTTVIRTVYQRTNSVCICTSVQHMIRTAIVRKTLQCCTKIIIKYYHGRILAGHIMNGKKLIAMRSSQNHTFFFLLTTVQ